MRRTLELLMLALLLQGCPDDAKEPAEGGGTPEGGAPDSGAPDSGAPASDGGGESDAQGGPAQDEKVGTFTVRLVAPQPATGSRPATSGHATINGTVFTGPVPEETVWEVDMEQGDCRLLTPRVPFCEIDCAGGVCVEDDQCQDSPAARSVGTLTVSGLKAAEGGSEFSVSPINGSYSTPGSVSLPHPPFEEGDEVRVKAPGEGAAPAFEIVAKGIAPFELTTTEFPLRPNMPLALAWKAPEQPELGRIEVKLDISHHGGTKGKVECDAGDTGSLEIAAPLVTKLLNLGVAGFPTITVSRVSRGSVATSIGTVTLQLLSDVERGVDIEGLSSCADNSDCTGGKICQADLTCK